MRGFFMHGNGLAIHFNIINAKTWPLVREPAKATASHMAVSLRMKKLSGIHDMV
jgi:hypothetical protein